MARVMDRPKLSSCRMLHCKFSFAFSYPYPHKQLGWGVLSCCFPQLSSSKVRKSSRMYACYHSVNQEKGIFVRAVAATFTPPDSVFRYISKCWDGFNRKYPPDTPVQFLEQSWLHQLNNSAIFLVGRPPPA